jgi:hypothetical protein
MRPIHVALPLVLSCTAGCAMEAGTLEARVYGEAFIEDTIPMDVFVDGWSVTFDSFLVSIGGVTAQAGHDTEELTEHGFHVVDLARPSDGAGYVIARFDAPGGTYDHFGYVLAPSASAINLNADGAEFDALKTSGHSVRVRGTASRPGRSVTFAWGFGLTAVHAHCDVAQDVDGDTVAIEATIHGDHLFHDDLVAEEPGVAFDLIAADGLVLQPELAATDITGEARYQVGSFDVDDLWGFVSHQVGTLGHVNGEGHCEDVIVTGG